MARTKINPEENDIDVPSPSTSLTPTNPSDVGTPAGYEPDYYDSNDRDVEVPVLGLINNVGQLAKKFRNQSGNFVLGDTIIGETVSVIPVALVKFFRERRRDGKELKFGSPEAATAKTFATAREAAQAGYAVDFDNKAANAVEEAARIGFLVVAPEGDESGEFFLNAPGGLSLAAAKCSYQRGGYRGVFRPIYNHAYRLAQSQGIEVGDLNPSQVFSAAKAWTHLWTVSAVECTGNENCWLEPRVAKTSALSPEVVAWITENYGSGRI